MTDRDHFAAAALAGLLANPKNNDSTADTIRFWAWNWADAMLRERNRTENRPTVDGVPVPLERTNHAAAPVAWAVMLADGERIYDVYAIEEEAKAIDEAVTGNHGVVPLYRSPTLTDAEREAIREALEGAEQDARLFGDKAAAADAVALRGLLERLG